MEIHRHLEACIRPSTIREFAPRLKVALPPTDIELREKLTILSPAEDLASALACFDIYQAALASPSMIERIAYEAVIDAAAEGIVGLEFRYAPNFIRSVHAHLNFDEIHQAILRGVEAGKRETGIEVGLIGIVVRTDNESDVAWTTDFIIDNRDTFCAIDLAGPEIGYPCRNFKRPFQRAKAAGLHITIHAGESNYPGLAFEVLDAIDLLGAERIGHGIQIIKEPAVLDHVIRKGITLEVCPVSNWLTSSVPTLREHPIRKLLDAGVRVTVNSDDPVLFGTDLVREYKELGEFQYFTKDDFDRCNRFALHASFLPEAAKARIREKVAPTIW